MKQISNKEGRQAVIKLVMFFSISAGIAWGILDELKGGSFTKGFLAGLVVNAFVIIPFIAFVLWLLLSVFDVTGYKKIKRDIDKLTKK